MQTKKHKLTLSTKINTLNLPDQQIVFEEKMMLKKNDLQARGLTLNTMIATMYCTIQNSGSAPEKVKTTADTCGKPTKKGGGNAKKNC